MAQPAAVTEVPRVQVSVFEGVFARSLKAEGELAAALARAGYDIARPEASYPPALLATCLELASRHCFPQLSLTEGTREIGRRFMDGYRQTLVGSVLVAALPLLGPARMLARLPRMMGANQNFGHTVAKAVGEQHWTVDYSGNPPGVPPCAHYSAGCIEAALRLTRVEPTVTVTAERPDGFTLDIRW
jgi:uncharacterized protein (TIGR02265 family)